MKRREERSYLSRRLRWARQELLAFVMWANGPAVHQALGNAQGDEVDRTHFVGPRGQSFVEELARWADDADFAQFNFP